MSDTTDDLLARFEQIVTRLEAMAPPTAGQFAAVNPDGTPGNVAAGELIEAAWGNAVADTLHELGRMGSTSQVDHYTLTGAGTDVPCGSFTATSTGKYLILSTAYMFNTVTAAGSGRIHTKTNAIIGPPAEFAAAANTGVTVTAFGTYTLTAGVWPVFLNAWNTGAGDTRIGSRNTLAIRLQ